MQRAERFDLALYQFASQVYRQRLATIPAGVLPPSAAPPTARCVADATRAAGATTGGSAGEGRSCTAQFVGHGGASTEARVLLPGVEPADVAVSADDEGW